MHRLDLNSVMTLTEIPYVIVTDTMEESEIFRILKSPGARGISGKFVSNEEMDYHKFKELCRDRGIQMTSFESVLDFSNFKLNSDGLIPVVAQNYKTGEVLMLAYMNAEAFDRTVKTGKMTYYSRSRQSLWTKGETSGHFQYVKSLTIDCDKDTLLAKVEQIGLPVIPEVRHASSRRSPGQTTTRQTRLRSSSRSTIPFWTARNIRKRDPIQIIFLTRALTRF